MKHKIAIFLLFFPLISMAGGWACISRNLTATCNTWRMPVPHGWLVSTDNADHGAAITYVPDAQHEWNPNN